MSGPVVAQEPTPSTFVDVPVPRLLDWNDVNALIVDGERPDGRTFIYPDRDARDADSEGDGTGSVAFIGWDLDDGSGRAPGIQAVTDDFAFPVQNCIMASGERESDQFEGVIVPKTCSDAPGSSKRVFLEVQEVDVPIDLVFNLGVGDKRYKGVKDPQDDGGEALDAFRDEFGIGRIYRVIQKFINDTDERLLGIRVEVGTTDEDGNFTQLSFSDGVAFELSESVERGFFVGNTGAGPRSVWNPERYAHFSPKMFDTGERTRFDPGFLDDQASGLFPPQDVQTGTKTRYIDSGSALNEFGHRGAIRPNYFNLSENQGAGAEVVIPGNVFGYMMSDSIVPIVIERHDDGDPETEGDAIMAWWDGDHWRYGVADNFAIVPDNQLVQWAARLLGRNIDDDDPTRYGTAESDDLSGINMDTYLYLGEALLEEGDRETASFNTGDPRFDTITLRYTAISMNGFDGSAGTEEPEWTKEGKEAPALSSYMAATGVPVAINDSAVTGRNEAVEINVLANDLLDGALVDPDVATVEIASDPASGSVTVNADQTVTYTPGTGFTGEDTFTYTTTVDGAASNAATVKVVVVAPPDPSVPVARNDSGTTVTTNPVTINILANDTVDGEPVDPNEATVTLGGQPSFGSVNLNPDNTVTYTADAGALLPNVDYFTYTVSVEGKESNSALVIVRVDPDEVLDTIVPVAANDTARTVGTDPVTIDVLANDTYDGIAVPGRTKVEIVNAPGNGSVVVNDDQTVTYTANALFSGDDTFTYSAIVDGQVSAPATVTVTVDRRVTSSGGGGGCTVGSGNAFDPLLPGLVLLALGYLVLRRRLGLKTHR
ncbi:choice-of-anchor F family protein [Thioalkalivibrio sp. ALE30]|uniref:choice-of-anchor F family protein n=1 Tax=Thioalkalivibrio sp. ALE30 TaxID=1158181 RepID=UPI0018CA8B9D|nr:choice-of-anchor F family protein [Thioalkalivibrio sp. ALE30]